jgi:hypothetical protein
MPISLVNARICAQGAIDELKEKFSLSARIESEGKFRIATSNYQRWN